MSIMAHHRNNRRLANSTREEEQYSAGWYFCFGDSATISDYLNSKNGLCWILPKFLDALFRGIGQVAFANNPFSGMLILTGIFWYNVTNGLLVLGCTSIAVLTAVTVNIHPKGIITGHVLFNTVLFASVTSSLWTTFYKEPLPMIVYIFVCTGSSFSVLISNGLTNILSSFKPGIPILAIPFHILVFVTFACLKPTLTPLTQEVNHLITEERIISNNIAINRTMMMPAQEEIMTGLNSTNEVPFYSWDNLQNVILGVTLSGGQVIGISDFITSLLVYSATLIYSPILAFMCFHGATIGTVSGLYLTTYPNEEVFSGVWGFNGFLTCGAIGVFYIFNQYSFLNGTASAVFTAVLQFTITSYFTALNMPCFGLPFILSTVLFICGTSNGPQLVRAKTITFPEQQLMQYLKKHKENEPMMTDRNLISV